MNPEPPADADDDFSRLLEAYDEALAAGSTPAALPAAAPPELHARLERAQACLRWLQRQRRRSADSLPADSSTATAPEVPAASDPPSHGTCLGRFRILRELGRGGGGIVYLASDPLLRRQVALKVPRPEVLASPEARRRFLHEARTAAALHHPHLVPVHEAGEVGPFCYIVSAYCPGPSLAAWLQQGTAPVSPRTAAKLVADLADAVHYVHDRGVLHRDIKAGNVLLDPLPATAPAPDDAFAFVPRLTDFGLAKLEEGQTQHTRSGAILGTPAYMAPEQAEARAGEVGPHTDVYALGALLYEVLTGQPPFRGVTPLDTLRQVIADSPARPGRLRAGLPADLETICLKCLHKEPKRRYASAAELADDLRRFLAGTPIRGRQPSAWERLRHAARRHPAAAVALLAIAVAAVALPAALFWHTLRLQQANDLAADNERTASRNEARARQLAYASDLRLANHLLQQGEVWRMAELLERHVPGPGEDDWRGFEWRYHWRHRQALAEPLRMPEGETLLELAPDGRLRITVGPPDLLLKIWPPDEGPPLPLARHHAPRGLVVALTADGRTAAAPSGDPDTVTLWDTTTGKPRACFRPVPGVFSACFSLDGRRLALGREGEVQIWDVAQGKPCVRVPTGEDAAIHLAFAPDGRTLATVSWDSPNVIRFWGPANGKPLPRQIVSRHGIWERLRYSPRGTFLAALDTGGVVLEDASSQTTLDWPELASAEALSLAFSPDERVLATGGKDGRVRLWDMPSRAPLGSLHWQNEPIACLAFSADGQRLAVGTQNGTVYHVSPRPHGPDRLRPALEEGRALAMTPDGKTLAVADRYGTVHLVDVPSRERRGELRGHVRPLRQMVFAPDGRTLATVGGEGDGRICVWDVPSRRMMARLFEAEEGAVCVAFSPTAPLLAAGLERGETVLWDLSAQARRLVLKGHSARVAAVAFGPDGRALATGSTDGTVKLWDLEAGPSGPSAWATLRVGPPVCAVAFSPDGRSLVTGDGARWVHRWQIKGRQEPVHGDPLRLGYHPASSLRFFPGGKQVLVAEEAERARILDVATGTWVGDLSGSYWQADLSRDGRLLAPTPVQGTVFWYQLETAEVCVPFGHPLWPVRSLSFSPDGRALLTGSRIANERLRRNGLVSYDSRFAHAPASAVRLWEVETGRERPGPSGPATMTPPELVAASPDGRTLAAGGEDGSVRIWDVQGQRPPARRFLTPKIEKYVRWVEAASLLAPMRPDYGERVHALAFSPGGLLVAAGDRGSVVVWEPDNWRPLCTLPPDDTPAGWTCFTSDGRLILTRGGQIQFWEPRTGTLRSTLADKGDSPILCGALAPGGTLLAVASEDRRLRLWDVPSATARGELIGHLDRVSALAFSPDGKVLASASWDRTVKLWSPAALQELSTLERHADKIHCLAFSPNGTVLASGGEDGHGRGEVFLWRDRGR
jgi:WD40 repeat protein